VLAGPDFVVERFGRGLEDFLVVLRQALYLLGLCQDEHLYATQLQFRLAINEHVADQELTGLQVFV
jgi:hypothetical protein